jgi:hypothetical protein
MMGDDKTRYTTQLQAGLGLIEETKLLLSIYQPDMTLAQLHETALTSGLFPMVSARRLTNIIGECFSPRYVKTDAARHLKKIYPHLPTAVFNQFLLVFTALANQVLMDFITEVYWNRYAGGHDTVSTNDAKEFVIHAVNEGKTIRPWSETTIKRVSSYLVGCCADYGLLSKGRGAARQIQPVQLQHHPLFFFAYWLHFSGFGDNRILNHDIWRLFGLTPDDVKENLAGIAKKDWLIVQSAGQFTRISWRFNRLSEVADVIAQG